MANSGDSNSGDSNSGDSNSGDRNSGYGNSGDSNSGYWNSGYRNSGNRNSGDRNSGYRNSGDWNSGYRNSGDWNSGNWNSGDSNSGNWNSGYWNSGDSNSGDSNSGNWNSGDRNSGYCNTNQPPNRIFNKETSVKSIYFPDYFYFDLTKWIEDGSVCGGHLEALGYKDAWRKSWDKASKEDREKTLKLPNFDNKLFMEISGIDVLAELNKDDDVEIIVEGNRKVISQRSAKALGLI